MPPLDPQTGAVIKMMPVDGKQVEAIGYDSLRTLYVRFVGKDEILCFKDVPRFRYMGLTNAPRKDAYYITYIKNSFLSKPAPSAA